MRKVKIDVRSYCEESQNKGKRILRGKVSIGKKKVLKGKVS